MLFNFSLSLRRCYAVCPWPWQFPHAINFKLQSINLTTISDSFPINCLHENQRFPILYWFFACWSKCACYAAPRSGGSSDKPREYERFQFSHAYAVRRTPFSSSGRTVNKSLCEWAILRRFLWQSGKGSDFHMYVCGSV